MRVAKTKLPVQAGWTLNKVRDKDIKMSWALFQQAARARPFWLATASGAALAACPVLAQTQANPAQPEEIVGEPDLQTPDVVPTTTDAPAVKDEDQIGFAADNLNYDSDTEVVVAEGNVQMNREAIEMRSDKVTWNRKTGQVFAEGNVVIKNPEGDTAYGDKIELTDSLRDGVVENLLVVLDNGSRLAAIKGTRFDNGNIELGTPPIRPAPSRMTKAAQKTPAGRFAPSA